MDEIKQRLTDASDACIKTYEAWRKEGDITTRESLQEAVHELRKVAARLEIELAVSDRKAQGSEPIPIPSHRASRRHGSAEMEAPEDDNNNRANRGQPQSQAPRRNMQQHLRRPTADAPVQPAPEAGNEPAAAVSASDDAKVAKPLSLRRSGAAEAEQG